MSELSQLDELIESDILDALGQEHSFQDNDTDILAPIDEEEEEIHIEDFHEDEPIDVVEPLEKKEIQDSEKIEESPQDVVSTQSVPNINTNDLATLLGQLLNNKTIEITIKIKD